MNFQNLQLAQESGIATITLNRPEKRNALSAALVLELAAALDRIKKSAGVRCVVVDVRLEEVEPMAYRFLLSFA